MACLRDRPRCTVEPYIRVQIGVTNGPSGFAEDPGVAAMSRDRRRNPINSPRGGTADASDLKSDDPKWSCGFDSHRGQFSLGLHTIVRLRRLIRITHIITATSLFHRRINRANGCPVLPRSADVNCQWPYQWRPICPGSTGWPLLGFTGALSHRGMSFGVEIYLVEHFRGYGECTDCSIVFRIDYFPS